MSRLLTIVSQCGLFLGVPGATLLLGIWLISRYFGFNRKIARLWVGTLVGIVGFEASMIGIIIDPRSNSMGWQRILLTSGAIGAGTFLFVMLLTPIYVALVKLLRR